MTGEGLKLKAWPVSATLDLKGARAALVESSSHIDMVMRPRAGMAGQVPVLSGSGEISTGLILPATMHQVGRFRLGATGGSAAEGGRLPKLEMEQYLVGGKMYVKMTDPATGYLRSATTDGLTTWPPSLSWLYPSPCAAR